MNLFLVTSPFQLICAIEAKNHYSTTENILIIKEEKSIQSQRQMSLLLKDYEWTYIIQLKRKNKVWEMRKLYRQLKKLQPDLEFNYIFYADYSAWRTAVLLNNTHCQKEVMIDDGIGTIREYKEKIQSKLHIYKNKTTMDCMLNLSGLRAPREIYPRKHFSFFTFFKLPASEYPIEINTFQVLKKRLGTKDCYSEHAKVGFIGQGMVGIKGLKPEDYCNILQKILDKHPQGIIYFPHRTEPDFVKDKIMHMDNIEYHQSKLPLELELALQGVKLSTLYGISSTANVTLENIYPEIPVYNIYIPAEQYIIPAFGENAHSVAVYLNFKSSDINLISHSEYFSEII